MTNKKNKTNRQKRTLIGAIVVAGIIMAGSTFAWFTSTDEVTNRLTASADYGVTISEDFTPPENWVPGQEIEKNVYVTNTGNVDAFVRVWLEGEFNLISEGEGISASPTTAYAPAEITNNDTLKNLGFQQVTVEDNTSYVKVLSTTKTVNPNNSNAIVDATNALSEVQALQAGGYLAYAPTGAKYKYTINQNKNVDVYYDEENNAGTDIPAGSTVIVGDTAAAPSGTTYIAPANTAGDIDSDTFLPMTTGLYLFRRNMAVDVTTDKDWEYSGYYYVAKSGDTGGQGKYYALKTKTTTTGEATVYVDGITLSSGSGAETTWYVDQQTGAIKSDTALTGVKLFTAGQSVVTDDKITWTYTAKDGDTPAKLTAAITSTASNDAKKISVDVALVNIDGTSSPNESWQYVPATNDNYRATFYYKNDVEEGDTTAKLVDSVTLSEDTKQTAYIAFDFDLNVFMDSIQVSLDGEDNESVASVNPWEATGTKAVAQKATVAENSKEINSINWKTPD